MNRVRRHRLRSLAALGLPVLVAHACMSEWLADRMSALERAHAMPPRMEVVYVREMAPAVPPPAAPAAPAAPPPPTPVAAVAVVAEAASAPEPAASQAQRDLTRSRRAKPVVEATQEPIAAAPAASAVERQDGIDTDTAADRALTPRPGDDASGVNDEKMAETTTDSTAEIPVAPLRGQNIAASASPSAAGEPASAATTRSRPVPEPATATATAASAGSGAADAADVAPFDWPVSTRVSYRLSGNVRGEVHGDAQVEWIREGSRYQVHLDVTVGLHVAPLMTRRMSSDGDITAAGLSPRRYDQDTRIGFNRRQFATVLFEPGAVVLANGERRERWVGLQDTASQFIQLTYLFGTRPDMLREGGSVEMPLALPRSTSRWVYDVVHKELVYTPIGPVDTFYLRPRRAVAKGGDLNAEIWFAPQWRYLPVRIRIRQDEETFVDLVMDRKPQLAAR